MPKLSETLGSLLRDVAYSRIKSDLFSKEASLEYARDPLLRAFPVPRVDIRSAEIELVFAVAEAVRGEVDERGASAAAIRERVPALRDRLLAAPVKPARSSRQLAPLAAALGVAAGAELDARLDAFVRENEAALLDGLAGDAEQFAKTVARAAVRAAREAAASGKSTVTVGAQFQEEAEAAAREWAAEVRAAAEAAVERLRAGAFSLELAVTAGELAKLPETAMARVRVVVDVGNYDWVESEDEDGKPVDRLTPR